MSGRATPNLAEILKQLSRLRNVVSFRKLEPVKFFFILVRLAIYNPSLSMPIQIESPCLLSPWLRFHLFAPVFVNIRIANIFINHCLTPVPLAA